MAVKMHGICALSALLLAAAWADHHHHHHDGSDHSHEGEMSCHKLLSPNADFAFALYKILKANAAPGKNIIFSPLGISNALSMLSAGARGETHSQLFSTLGYSTLNQTQVNKAYEHLFHLIGQSQEESQQLDVSNGVALRPGFNPLEKFLNDVKHYYSGEVFNVDFTNSTEASAEINTFIANKTQGKINHTVKELDPDMVMMLINTVYFEARWKSTFHPDLTRKMDFHVNKTTTVKVDMMFRMDYYDEYWDPDNFTSVLMMPHKGNTSMMVILPFEGHLEEVEGYITKDHINHWRKEATREYIWDLFLPKFSVSADAPLENILKEMGITNAFEDSADFSGMSDGAKLKVSKMSHRAVLSVTEMGTEPPVGLERERGRLALPLPYRVDRPFWVLILEDFTDSILFMAKINNPTAI